MYNDDEERKNLPIKTFLVSLILIIIFVLLLVWLLPMPNLTGLNNRIFNANIQEMKNAAIPYFTTDKLPQKDGDSVKLTLQEMIDAKLILPFTDKNGDTCDTKASYIELTKKSNDDGYELKTYLKCNGEDDYVLVTLGCYSYCKNAVCEKETKDDGDKTPTPSVTPNTKPNTTPSSTPSSKPSSGDPSCTLVVTSGTSGENGWYKSNVVIGFGSKSAGKNASISAFGIGTSTTYANNKTFTVSAEGSTTVYGYVKASTGKTATCKLVVKKDTVDPECKVAVLSGSQGSDGVYTGDVVVGFTSKTDVTSGVVAFGINNSSTKTFNGKTDYKITSNGTHKIYGFVKDNAGHVKSCNVSIKRNKPSTPQTSSPSCVLQITNGNLGSNNWYTSNAVVGFKSKQTTGGATITGYGIGTSETYANNASYTVTKDGIHTIYGYVKDSNGNKSICSISVKRDATKPTCSLKVTSGTYNSNGYYTSDIVVGFNAKDDKTSGMNSFGIGKTTTFTNNTSYKITEIGRHTIYGYVKDNAGNTNTCSITVEKKQNSTSTPSCSLQVTNGTVGNSSWYTSNVVIGFKSKQTTNGASITGYGIGTSTTYANNATYTVSKDGTYTVYGYVKDSNGYTATCSISVKRDATKPTCSLKVTSGSYNSNGYYTSDIVIGFNAKNDVTSGMNSFGIGKTTTYTNNTSYKITEIGKHTVYGYVKDNAGNTNTCSITVEKRNNLEYQYKKDIAAEYSKWSDWTKLTYNPSNRPSFGKYALIEIVDLGKTQELDHYEYSTGDPIKQTVKVKVGTVSGTYCSDYNYYRVQTTTTTTTYAVAVSDDWTYVGRVTRTSAPTDTMTVRYEFVGLDWSDCGTGCSRAPRQIWNKFTRKAYIASSTNTVTSSDGVVVKCAKTSSRTVTIYSNVEKTVGYDQIRKPVYKDVYYYQRRTRTLTHAAYTDYKWSYYNDQSLLNQGYAMTGNTRIVG